MATKALAKIHSHWHRSFEGLLDVTPKEFYARVEDAVERRQIPDVVRSRVDWHEGGMLSAKREYLRVQRNQYVFDICGAPFGNGFFVSSWAGEFRSGPATLFLVLIGLAFAVGLLVKIFDLALGLFLSLFAVPALVWYLARHTPVAFEGWDDPIVELPLIGPVYEKLFRPVTYYKIDTAQMFHDSVHTAVLEVVDEITKVKGLRALTELEQKPVHTAFSFPSPSVQATLSP